MVNVQSSLVEFGSLTTTQNEDVRSFLLGFGSHKKYMIIPSKSLIRCQMPKSLAEVGSLMKKLN